MTVVRKDQPMDCEIAYRKGLAAAEADIATFTLGWAEEQASVRYGYGNASRFAAGYRDAVRRARIARNAEENAS